MRVHLAGALGDRKDKLSSLVVWPFFDPLREDLRFVDLVTRMGYPQ